MQIDPDDTILSRTTVKVALAVMHALLACIGSPEEPEPTAKDLYRVLALMTAMVLETDVSLTPPGQFREAATYHGEISAMFAKIIRHEHERTGMSLMDLVVIAGTGRLN